LDRVRAAAHHAAPGVAAADGGLGFVPAGAQGGTYGGLARELLVEAREAVDEALDVLHVIPRSAT
jgi:hypothetical protein